MSLTCLPLDSALQHCCDVTEFPRLQGAVCSVPHRPRLPAQVHLQESRATSNTAVTAQLTRVSSGLRRGAGAWGFGVHCDMQEQETCITVPVLGSSSENPFGLQSG